jgi:hypothetical protein
LPSRALGAGGCGLPGVGQEPGVDGVADAAFEGPKRLLVGLALGDLLLVVGAAVAVLVADLVIAAMWITWLARRFPFSDSRWVFRSPEDTLAGAVPL